LTGIPIVPFETSTGGFDLSSVKSITVDSQYADTIDDDGSTLIPPSLSDFASTFAGDLGSGVEITTGSGPADGSIFLTLGDNDGFVDRAGRKTSEAYKLDVAAEGITVTGASPLGVWWGTRSILQQGVLGEGSIPVGSGVDAPGWGTRGVTVSHLDCRPCSFY
jgi:hexosaminidase